MHRRSTRITIIVLVLLAVAGGAMLAQQQADRPTTEGQGLATVLEVIALLRTYHVEGVDTFSLVRSYWQHGTINGMLRDVLDDDYTRFMNPGAFERMQDDTLRGEFGGIGIMVGIRDERLTIISPIAGTPGFNAGLRGGDLIIRVDDQPTENMSLDEAVSLMRGPIGEPVELTVERGEEIIEVPVVRALIEVQSVQTWDIITPEQVPGLSAPVGYIYLADFSEKTMGQVNGALREMEEAGIGGLIFDVRNNGGGLLNVALELADRFIADGPLLHVVTADERRTYVAQPGGTLADIPVALLINEYSASASEILAGALRDNDRAVLVGNTTFGKGSVQTVVPVRGGGGLALTTAHYETAGGHFIHDIGIEPDFHVEIPEDELEEFYDSLTAEGANLDDIQLQKALQLLLDMMTPNAAGATETGAVLDFILPPSTLQPAA